MKKLYILIIGLLLVIGLQAQITKTIENTAGNLKTLLSETELSTVTDLTITGTMDARDFFTIRIWMSVLTHLDISNVSIVAFSGSDPTLSLTPYEANVIPDRALQWKRTLSTLLLPSSITAIDVGAFWGCEALSSVIIPSSVTSIGDAAFMDCGLLQTVTLTSALTSIGVQAFDMCESLTSLSIPSSVAYIGDNAFRKCSSLTEMVIPSSLTAIEKGTFSYCSALTTVTLSSTITKIGKDAFFRCSSLTSIDLPSGITEISDNCFSDCTALNTVVLPSSLISIGINAFSDCTSLISITIPSSVSTIGINAFSGCSALKAMELPAALTLLEPGVFYLCNQLTSITIPASVTSIGDNAFKLCSNLESVVIPSAVSYIGSSAFEECTNLKNIWSYRSEPVLINETTFYSLDKSACTLHVPYGSGAYYAAANVWKDFIIVSDTAGIGISANSLRFEVNGGEFQITVNSTLAWQASSDQTWVTVSPASGNGNGTVNVTAEANTTSTFRFARITFIPDQGEPQIISITQKSDPVVIPITAGNLLRALTPAEMDTITRLTLTGTINVNDIDFVNVGFPKLTYLDLSNTKMTSTVAYYGYYADNWWPGPTIWKNSGNIGGLYKKSLKTVKLPATVEILGCGAFSGSGITTLDIPPSVSTIGWSAFAFCPSLETITIPATVKSINQWVFDGCPALKEAIIEAPLTTIPRGTFASCSSLSAISIPPTVRSIQMSAFYGCSSLTTLDLPASVAEIENVAFYSCTALSSITSYNPIPPSLEGGNFEEVFTTCQLNVPYGSAALYAAAEGWKNFTHIVEMTGFELSTIELNLEAVPAMQSITITTREAWNTSCDKDWLTVSPASGDSSQTVTFTCQENTSIDTRTATVTFTDVNGYSQSVTITQKARMNSIPVANAGADQWAEEDTLVQLDGSASTDADGDALTYQWTAPEGIILSSTTDAQPTFTAPKLEKDTTYIFDLVVNDGKENSLIDAVLITVTNKTIVLGVSTHAVVFESKASSAKIRVTGNAQWTALSDQEWLSISPLSGEGPKEITLTALANDTPADRVGTVTVSAPETNAQTITITQHGLATGVEEMTRVMEIKFHPNPFTSEMAIAVTNPSLKEVTVEIYSISGQKIKTLARALKGAKISLNWNGTDEQGKQVPKGIYLLKVNEQVSKVVYGG